LTVSSWVISSTSSSFDIWSSLMACWSEGVMTSFVVSRMLSFCSSAIALALS
jgi:hypothetical protein